VAKINDGVFKNWQDVETIHAAEYVQEREMLRVAANDNAERIESIEESIVGFQLGNAQLQKITNDNGSPIISVNATSGDVLAEILALGRGMRTFYAVSGSKNLPPTNISIRGISHLPKQHLYELLRYE
jgi:hypothetical protein